MKATKTIKKITRPLINKNKYGDADLDPVEFLVFKDRQLVVLVLSKVACTSIKATIGKKYGINFYNQSGLDIHSNKNWERSFGKLPKEFKNYEIATFVRNPFARIVSCYKDRVIYDEKNMDFNKYYFSNYPYEIPPNIDFSKFVQLISKIPDAMSDRHFKGQMHSILKLDKEIDYVGRLENIKTDWEIFADKYGFDKVLEKLNPSDRFNTQLEKDYRKYYNAECIDLVSERYKQDIIALEYTNEEDLLRDFVVQNER